MRNEYSQMHDQATVDRAAEDSGLEDADDVIESRLEED